MIINNCVQISVKRIKLPILNKNNNSSIINNLLDLIFFTAFGCTLILVAYTTLDGSFRFYIPLSSILSLILFNKSLGNFISKRINKILNLILFCYVFSSIIIIHYPVKLILIFKKLIFRLLNNYKKRCAVIRSNNLIQKKQRDIKSDLRIYN